MKIPQYGSSEEPELRLECFRFTFHQVLQLDFSYAIQIIDQAAELNRPDMTRQFNNAFEGYQFQLTLMRDLEHSRRRMRLDWLDQKYYNLTSADLFHELKPSTQQLLLKQGLQL
ncbi:MAG: hypothetical protein ABSF91_09810 [Bacteroidota bacterium]|jgi:hypothetical protein